MLGRKSMTRPKNLQTKFLHLYRCSITKSQRNAVHVKANQLRAHSPLAAIFCVSAVGPQCSTWEGQLGRIALDCSSAQEARLLGHYCRSLGRQGGVFRFYVSQPTTPFEMKHDVEATGRIHAGCSPWWLQNGKREE